MSRDDFDMKGGLLNVPDISSEWNNMNRMERGGCNHQEASHMTNLFTSIFVKKEPLMSL